MFSGDIVGDVGIACLSFVVGRVSTVKACQRITVLHHQLIIGNTIPVADNPPCSNRVLLSVTVKAGC